MLTVKTCRVGVALADVDVVVDAPFLVAGAANTGERSERLTIAATKVGVKNMLTIYECLGGAAAWMRFEVL